MPLKGIKLVFTSLYGPFKGLQRVCNPLIGFKNNCFESLKSNLLGFPAGFEHVGPRIRTPREQLGI